MPVHFHQHFHLQRMRLRRVVSMNARLRNHEATGAGCLIAYPIASSRIARTLRPESREDPSRVSTCLGGDVDIQSPVNVVTGAMRRRVGVLRERERRSRCSRRAGRLAPPCGNTRGMSGTCPGKESRHLRGPSQRIAGMMEM
jgi:hypothetical protein